MRLGKNQLDNFLGTLSSIGDVTDSKELYTKFIDTGMKHKTLVKYKAFTLALGTCPHYRKVGTTRQSIWKRV